MGIVLTDESSDWRVVTTGMDIEHECHIVSLLTNAHVRGKILFADTREDPYREVDVLPARYDVHHGVIFEVGTDKIAKKIRGASSNVDDRDAVYHLFLGWHVAIYSMLQLSNA